MTNAEIALMLAALVGFSVLAWAKMMHIPFIITGIISVMSAWYVPGNNTTALSITISIGLLGYGLLCLGMAYGIIFIRPKQSEGEE